MQLNLEINLAQSFLTDLIPINKFLLCSLGDAYYDGVCGCVSDQARMWQVSRGWASLLYSEEEKQT